MNSIRAVSTAVSTQAKCSSSDGGHKKNGESPSLKRKPYFLQSPSAQVLGGRGVAGVLCESSNTTGSFIRKKLSKKPSRRGITNTKKTVRFDREKFILPNPRAFEDVYEILGGQAGKLGDGAYGTVCVATDRTSGMQRAVKKMKISKMQGDDWEVFQNEVDALIKLDHPHIVKLVEYTGRTVFFMSSASGHLLPPRLRFLRILGKTDFTHAFHACTLFNSPSWRILPRSREELRVPCLRAPAREGFIR